MIKWPMNVDSGSYIDLASWPAACRWIGPNIEGLTVGLRI